MEEKHKIHVNPDTDPRTDPNSPEFDPIVWKKEMESSSIRIEAMKQGLATILKEHDNMTCTILEELPELMSALASAIIYRNIEINPDDFPKVLKQTIADFKRITQALSYDEQSGGQISLFPEDKDQQRLKSEVLTALPHLQSLIPQKHLIPNNKLANSLTQDIIDAGIIEIDVSGKREKELITRCILNYEGDNVKLSSRQPFTEYDRNVADAVTSLYEYGDSSHVITAAQVFRAMVHATETETPSPQQIGAVTRSLDKMRFVRVQIDCTEELTRRKINLNGTQITNGKIDTYLLSLKKLEVLAGGQKVTAYKIIDTPILYDYSRLTGQVLTVPATLLDIRDKNGIKVANTERRIAIKGYLMRRISIMKGKNGKRHSKHILYEDTYKKICEGPPSEKEQRLIREYIDLVLDDWIRQQFIAGYSVLTKGKKKIGIEISLSKQSTGG